MAEVAHDREKPGGEHTADSSRGEHLPPPTREGPQGVAFGSATASHDVETIPAHGRRPPPLQGPLVLGQPHDATEVEADAVADRGHGTTWPPDRATMSSGRESMAAAHEALRGPGRELDQQARLHFHRSLGHDFGDVRVYTSSEASRAARDLDAHAFSVGARIGFADGELSTTTGEGRHLLAHELAHVLQDRRSSTPRVVRRKPWGRRPKGTRLPASHMFLWGSAEAYAVLQYIARNSGHVLITNEMLATGVRPNATGADKAVVDAIYSEFHHGHEVKRRSVAPPAGVTDRAEADPLGTLQAATDTAKALQQPDIVDVTTSEVYDVTTVGERDAKVLKINNRYVRLLNTITSRSWRAGTSMQPFVPLTKSLGKLGTISFAPTDLARWPGVLQYEVIKAEGKKNKKPKKKGKEKAKKSPAKKSPAKKSPAKKPGTTTPGGNFGFGIGIMSSGGGKGNAALGVSINSSGTSVGTVSAGVVYNSNGDAVGAVAVGAGANTSGATAASATAGGASGSTGTSVATAGAGTSKDSSSTSVASAGAGSTQDVSVVAIGEAGTGDAAEVDARGKPGAPGGSTTGAGGGAATGAGGGAATGGAATSVQGRKGDASTTSQDGGHSEQGEVSASTPGTGGRAGGLSVPGSTDTQATAAVSEAARIDAELRSLNEAQRHLLVAIIQQSEAGQHDVASARSVAAFKSATSGLSEADLAFLETRQWVPGDVSAEVLRRQIEEHLRNRRPAQGEPPSPAQAKALDRDEKAAEKTIKKPPQTKSSQKKPSTETDEALFRRLLDRAKTTDWSTISDPGMVTWSKDEYGEVSGVVYVNTVIDGTRVRLTGDIAGIRTKTAKGDVLEVTATSAILVSPDGLTSDGTAWVGQRLTFEAR